MISGKWRIAVLYQLSERPLGTSQLQKALQEIAPKVLTQTLRCLERDGLVRRRVYAATPPHVECRLTEPAHLLISALDELCRWSEVYAGTQAETAREFTAS